jgi:hypothetical protein
MAELPFPAEALPWLAKADSDLRTAQAALGLVPPAILDLNPFAVQFRYPGEEAAPEVEEVQAGLDTAVSIRRRVQSLLPPDSVEA